MTLTEFRDRVDKLIKDGYGDYKAVVSVDGYLMPPSLDVIEHHRFVVKKYVLIK